MSRKQIDRSLCAVVLAAGLGKRMNSIRPKVLHEVLGRPMLLYCLDAVKTLKPEKLIVVVGFGEREVKKSINDKSVIFVTQEKPLGTGNALAVARNALKRFKQGTIIVLNGDAPLITGRTLKNFLGKHRIEKNALSLLSFVDEKAAGYGRILRDDKGQVVSIVEDKEAAGSQKTIDELNGGVYAMEPKVLDYLDMLEANNSSGEYYLTDIVGIIHRRGLQIGAYRCDPDELRGVNTREELSKVAEVLNKRIVSEWMRKGVTFLDPGRSIVHHKVSIGKDSIIYPDVYLEGNTSIGEGSIVYPGVRIVDTVIGRGVIIKDNTLIEESTVGDGSTVGPFAHLRPHSNIGKNVKVGNFVEIKKSTIGNGSKTSHLSYIGDAILGKNINIGAGTITCNYDGLKKHLTMIEDDVFVGSDSQLVAPVKIGRGAYVAAGSTITKDVPRGALAIGRAKQENIKGWALKKKLKVKSLKVKRNEKK